jgi:hypothetical protein
VKICPSAQVDFFTSSDHSVILMRDSFCVGRACGLHSDCSPDTANDLEVEFVGYDQMNLTGQEG